MPLWKVLITNAFGLLAVTQYMYYSLCLLHGMCFISNVCSLIMLCLFSRCLHNCMYMVSVSSNQNNALIVFALGLDVELSSQFP